MGGIPNKRRGPEGEVPRYLSTKIDETIITRARIIAAHKRTSLSDYLSNTLDSCVDRDFKAMVEDYVARRFGAMRPDAAE